ncbi:DUF3120 domain-containing protein [Anthocerotibacter panamensis]|uniref:DUF3120 domain-containing protein n=1 Tax=Anthocerotibacter panamensis TaxID=2857077 RepID=UPI001C4088E3|nr:DUF3120 domain-containing protein [Anthocerotibacter panamensis]
MLTTLTSKRRHVNLHSWGFWASAFLVSIPVFFQAPLVRTAPQLSLGLTLFWLGLSYMLRLRSGTRLWGSLLFGFTLSWWCGSLYWGWLRFDPVWHLPIEALGFPLALLALRHFRAGAYFYAGSFVGTALTDLYIWSVDLTPWWVRMMRDESPQNLSVVMNGALTQMHSLPGVLWAVAISGVLLVSGMIGLRKRNIYALTFAGAVLSTLFVDALFWAGSMFLAGQ